MVGHEVGHSKPAHPKQKPNAHRNTPHGEHKNEQAMHKTELSTEPKSEMQVIRSEGGQCEKTKENESAKLKAPKAPADSTTQMTEHQGGKKREEEERQGPENHAYCAEERSANMIGNPSWHLRGSSSPDALRPAGLTSRRWPSASETLFFMHVRHNKQQA